MPFRVFNEWLFDGRKDTPIPRLKTDDTGKVITPDILKYNSPITHTFVISMFLKHGPLNFYLNKYFNDFNLRSLEKEELFFFIKKCVQDFKIQRSSIMFYPRRAKMILYDKLRERMPLLKNDDLLLLSELIERSDNKEAIYNSLGLERPQKIKINKEKKITTETISLKNFLSQHFSTMEV